MLPIVFSIAGFHIYSLSIALILSWLVFSFIFWQKLRSLGTAEERIFDLTFYSTIWAFVGARMAFVLPHFVLFRGDLLRIAAIWVVPGMSLYGALFGGLAALIYLSRRYKVRVGQILDSFAIAFGWSYIPGLLGALLDGSYVGLPARVLWAIRYTGYVGLRHPVQVYEMVFILIILIVMQFLSKKAVVRKWPYGLLGLWFFVLFAAGGFVLEYFKATPVYLAHLRLNQWILIALFAETMGAFYVRGGGREVGRHLWYNFQAKFSNNFAYILRKKKSGS